MKAYAIVMARKVGGGIDIVQNDYATVHEANVAYSRFELDPAVICMEMVDPSDVVIAHFDATA